MVAKNRPKSELDKNTKEKNVQREEQHVNTGIPWAGLIRQRPADFC